MTSHGEPCIWIGIVANALRDFPARSGEKFCLLYRKKSDFVKSLFHKKFNFSLEPISVKNEIKIDLPKRKGNKTYFSHHLGIFYSASSSSPWSTHTVISKLQESLTFKHLCFSPIAAVPHQTSLLTVY